LLGCKLFERIFLKPSDRGKIDIEILFPNRCDTVVIADGQSLKLHPKNIL
jgi:murein L,D-transpeptidase YafK